jgi:hypothetical protein
VLFRSPDSVLGCCGLVEDASVVWFCVAGACVGYLSVRAGLAVAVGYCLLRLVLVLSCSSDLGWEEN